MFHMTSGHSPVSLVPLWLQIILSTHAMDTYFTPTESLFGSSALPPTLLSLLGTRQTSSCVCVRRREPEDCVKVPFCLHLSFCIAPALHFLAVFEDHVLKNRLSVPEPWSWVIQKYAYLHPPHALPPSSPGRMPHHRTDASCFP